MEERDITRIPRLLILRILCVGAALLGCIAPVHATPFFRPDLPDFYQHQKSGSDLTKPYNNPGWPPNPGHPPDAQPNPLKPGYNNGNWWEDGSGWCCAAAFTNSFYSLDKQGFVGLFDHSAKSPSGLGGTPADQDKTWQERMAYAIEDLRIETDRTGKTIPDFLAKYGYGPDKLSYSEFFLDGGKVKKSNGASLCGVQVCVPPPGSTSTTFTSLFDAYSTELLRGEDVELRIEYPSFDPTRSCPDQNLPWWCTSFHILTGAGVERDKTQLKLWFADPNDTIHGANWGHPYTNTDELPVGVANYTMAMLMADEQTFATGGPYAGAKITRIFAISPVSVRQAPGPSTLTVMAVAMLALLGYSRWHRNNEATPRS